MHARIRFTTLLVTLLAALLGAGQAVAQSEPLKIGIIGTGRIGGALARHWVNAGHEVLMSSRHPEELAPLAAELGPRARAGTPAEAAAFGDVVLVSVPYSAMPQVGAENGAALAGKIVLDTSNPVAQRDGAIVGPALEKGSGLATAEFLPGARVVRAFNCIPAESLANQANRMPARIAIPLAGDDAEALEVAQRLVDEAGFDPVVVGPLEVARHFDLGQPLARGNLSAEEYRALIDEVL
ncbi:MAG TPA: NADPH-dependent F420 reductase [Gammaproteobacteria bacterium]|nr:NADPH-dependent F420 reductase [Gammaproteobacteria bacterium]